MSFWFEFVFLPISESSFLFGFPFSLVGRCSRARAPSPLFPFASRCAPVCRLAPPSPTPAPVPRHLASGIYTVTPASHGLCCPTASCPCCRHLTQRPCLCRLRQHACCRAREARPAIALYDHLAPPPALARSAKPAMSSTPPPPPCIKGRSRNSLLLFSLLATPQHHLFVPNPDHRRLSSSRPKAPR